MKSTRWVNIYPITDGAESARNISSWTTREHADKFASPDREACLRIEYEKGDGLIKEEGPGISKIIITNFGPWKPPTVEVMMENQNGL